MHFDKDRVWREVTVFNCGGISKWWNIIIWPDSLEWTVCRARGLIIHIKPYLLQITCLQIKWNNLNLLFPTFLIDFLIQAVGVVCIELSVVTYLWFTGSHKLLRLRQWMALCSVNNELKGRERSSPASSDNCPLVFMDRWEKVWTSQSI
jgi:hypothetical protein